MPLYICRWRNGDFSVVDAHSLESAMLLLDEIGDAEVCELLRVENFMVHFRLKDKIDSLENVIPLELRKFGGETLDALYTRVYPVYGESLVRAVNSWLTKEPAADQAEQILKELNDALFAERSRQSCTQTPRLSEVPETNRFQNVGRKTVQERATKGRQFP